MEYMQWAYHAQPHSVGGYSPYSSTWMWEARTGWQGVLSKILPLPSQYILAYYAWPQTSSTKVTRKERNPWRQNVHHTTRPRSYAIDKVWEAVTSRCLGNGRSDATCKQYGSVSASYKQFSVSASYKQYVSDECTYNIQSRQKHDMLSLLHAACLKLIFFSTANEQFKAQFYIILLRKIKKKKITVFEIRL